LSFRQAQRGEIFPPQIFSAILSMSLRALFAQQSPRQNWGIASLAGTLARNDILILRITEIFCCARNDRTKYGKIQLFYHSLSLPLEVTLGQEYG